jgi:hypothetical protein
MSASDVIHEKKAREEKVEQMDAMCVMVKGKQTYLGLIRRQWIDRFLEVDPSTKPEDLKE